jgi:hypothetical protein
MSALIYPFLFKKNLLNNHNIKLTLPFFEEKRLFTAANSGEIIVWKYQEENLIPDLILLPCLNQNVGSISAMTIMRMAESELLVIFTFNHLIA